MKPSLLLEKTTIQRFDMNNYEFYSNCCNPGLRWLVKDPNTLKIYSGGNFKELIVLNDSDTSTFDCEIATSAAIIDDFKLILGGSYKLIVYNMKTKKYQKVI